MAETYATRGSSRSRMLLPPTWDSRVHSSESRNRFHRDSTFDPVKEHSEWYKHLDFEDKIFIPGIYDFDARRVSRATTSCRYGEYSSNGTTPLRQAEIEVLAVANLEPVAWHIRPLPPSSISVSENTIELVMTIPVISTPTSNRNFGRTEISNSANHHFVRYSPSRALPQSQTFQIPIAEEPYRIHQYAQEIAHEIMAEQQRVNRERGTRTHASFVPSRAALERKAQEYEGRMAFQRRAGRPDSQSKHYGQRIEDHKNCAVFITGIPMNATYADVLDSVRGGKIFICRFEPVHEKFPTRAAKLVFFKRASAERFMHQSVVGGIYILGERVRAVWNRIKYDECNSTHQSRVVKVTGLARWVRSPFLEDYFKELFNFDVDRIVDVPGPRQGYVTRAWHFACLRAQADFAKMVIDRQLKGVFTAEFGADPCNRPWF